MKNQNHIVSENNHTWQPTALSVNMDQAGKSQNITIENPEGTKQERGRVEKCKQDDGKCLNSAEQWTQTFERIRYKNW